MYVRTIRIKIQSENFSRKKKKRILCTVRTYTLCKNKIDRERKIAIMILRCPALFRILKKKCIKSKKSTIQYDTFLQILNSACASTVVKWRVALENFPQS